MYRVLSPAILLLLMLSIYVTQNSQALSINDVKKEILKTYEALNEAEEAGGNVSSLASKLNNLIDKIHEIEEDPIKSTNVSLLNDVMKDLEEIRSEAQLVKEEGARLSLMKMVFKGGVATCLVVGALLATFYVPKIAWKAWLKVKRRWKVKPL